VAFFLQTQGLDLVGLSVLACGKNEPAGATGWGCFLGFLASLLLRNWPFAMIDSP